MITTISQKEDFEMFFPEQSNNFYKLLFEGLVKSKQIYGENGVMMINDSKLDSNGFKGFIGTVNSDDDSLSIDNIIMLHKKPINKKYIELNSSSNKYMLKDEKKMEISSDYVVIDSDNIKISLPFFKLDNSIDVPYIKEIRIQFNDKSMTTEDRSDNDRYNIPAICRNAYYNKSYPYVSLDTINFEENDTVYIDTTVFNIDNVDEIPDYELIKTPNGVYVKWLVSSISESITFERGEYSEKLNLYEFTAELIKNHNIIPTSRGEQNSDHIDDQLQLSI